MNEKIEIYNSIAKREKASRIEAEKLLEKKSIDLYAKNEELKKTTLELSSTNALLSKIMGVAPDGILLCSSGFIVLNVNATCERKLGRARSALIGAKLDDFFPNASAELKKTASGGFFVDQQAATLPTGNTFPVEMRGYVGCISDEAKYLIFFHDITNRLQAEEHRKEVEQQVDEARRLEAVGALSAGIAHEINTPIQFIGDNLDYLTEALQKIHAAYDHYDHLKEAVNEEKYEQHINAVNDFNNSVRLKELIPEITNALMESRDGIRQVRDIVLLMKEFSHPGSGAREETDLNKIVRNVVTLSRNRQKQISEIELDLEQELPPIKCRRGQVQQVILNIVLNALDAVDDKGTKEARVKVNTYCDQHAIGIAVSDTGYGVPAALREKIFDPFFTTKPVGKGTGQGLALAKDCIVKGHKGKLFLSEIPGFTTTFKIEFPRNLEISS